MRWKLVPIVLLAAAAAVSAADVTALRRQLDEAVRRYDTAAATASLSEIRAARAGDPSEELAVLHARASLAVAELLRLDYEQRGEDAAQERRIIGQKIDATAGEGLEVLAELADSSETHRVRADLIATMIRSDFRAKKYEAEFKAAVDRALELDRDNARAWVSAAKPLLFAPPEHGRDVEEAIRDLDRALELDPRLEQALLLRAYAHDQLGEAAAAERDWRAALALNPDSRPALERLGSQSR